MGHLCSPTQGVFEVGPAPPGGGGCAAASPIVGHFFCDAEQSGRHLEAQRGSYMRVSMLRSQNCVFRPGMHRRQVLFTQCEYLNLTTTFCHGTL